jgi:DNA-binding beta-propeller fold protein YncE
MSHGTLVVGSQAQKFDFYDAETLEKLGELRDILPQPHEITYDSKRGLLYVAICYRSGGYAEDNAKGHELAVIDVTKMEVVDYIELAPYFGPHDVEYDEATDLIYTGVESVAGLPGDERNGLLIVDPSTRKVVQNIPTSAPNTHWISLTAGGKRAYLAHKEYPAITVVDLEARKVLQEIEIPGGCEEVSSSPDGRFVYVAAPKMSLELNLMRGEIRPASAPPGAPNPALVKIDTETNTVVGRLEFPALLAATWVGADGTVFVSEFRFPAEDAEPGSVAAGYLNVIDGETFELRTSIACGDLPFTTRTNEDVTRAFVTNLKGGTVSVVDLAKGEVVATLENNVGGMFGGTHPLAYIPATEG